MSKKGRALILLILCNLASNQLSAQEVQGIVQPKAIGLWAWFSPEPPDMSVEGKDGKTWTGSGYQSQLQLDCIVPEDVKKDAQDLFNSVKQFYHKNNFDKEFEEIAKKEPRGCARKSVHYQLSIARQTLQWAAEK